MGSDRDNVKNQYFGDVNDYLKYGLLRCFANVGLSIGVCWMLTPDDARSDERKITYLSDPELWRPHDPALFDVLTRLVSSQQRHVRFAKNSACLRESLFFNQLVPSDRILREKWLTRALTKLAGAEVVFFDPDNGIEVRSKPKGSRGSDKYVYWDEIQRAWVKGSSLLIFQHFPRSNHQLFATTLMAKLQEHIKGGKVISLVTSNVLYLLACKPQHQLKLQKALDDIDRKWDGRISILS